MGHRQQHEVLRRKLAEAAPQAFPLREFLEAVGPARVGREQRRHRVPAVALQLARRRVVARHDQHVGLELLDSRDGTIELLDPLHLLGERAVLTGGVGVLEVEEEEIVVLQ